MASPTRGQIYPGLVDDRSYAGGTTEHSSSPMGAMHQLTLELDATRRDLESKEDLLAMTKREQERLKKLLTDTREDFRNRIEELAGEKAHAENRVLEQRIEVEKERGARKEIARELEDAINERERQVANVAEVRRMVDSKLSVLMAELHKKDEQVMTLQHLADSRGKDREKMVMLEKMLGTRDQQLSDVTAEYTTLQGAHNRLLVTSATLTQEVDAHRVLREATEIANNLNAMASPTRSEPAESVPPPPPTGPSSPMNRGGSQPLGYGVEHPSLLLPSQVAFAKDVMKDHTTFSQNLDSLYDDLTDLRAVLLKGAQHSSDHTDRKRLAALRQLDLNLQEQRRVGDGGTEGETPEHLQATMRIVREGTLRVKTTMAALSEFVHDLKSHTEKNCPYGLETAQRNHSMTKPAAWPLPGQEPQHTKTNSGSGAETPTQPPLQLQSTATYQMNSSPIAAQNSHAHHVVQDLESRLKLSDDTVNRLRAESLEKDKELSKLRLDGQESHHHVSLTESNLVRVEGQLKRTQDDLDMIREREKIQDARITELQRELTVAHDTTRDERERHLTAMSEKQREHEMGMQTSQRDTDYRVRELEQKHDHALRDFQVKYDKTERENAELISNEVKSVDKLQKSRERIHSLEQQRNQARADVDALKEDLTATAAELRHYQAEIQKLDQEYQHTKAVLEYEVSQRATDSLVQGGLSQISEMRGSGAQNSSRHAAAQHLGGPAITGASSGGMGMLGQDDGGPEWTEWKKTRTRQQQDTFDVGAGGQGGRSTAAPSAGVRAGSSSRRAAPPGVKIVKGPTEKKPSTSLGRSSRF